METDVRREVESAISEVMRVECPESDEMFPGCSLKVDVDAKSIDLNGIALSPENLRGILLSVQGRGMLLNFSGYEGVPPQWLVDDVLLPTGYISKLPKIPVGK